jgi:hypothetical protein
MTGDGDGDVVQKAIETVQVKKTAVEALEAMK